jgi:hypothetical protein
MALVTGASLGKIGAVLAVAGGAAIGTAVLVDDARVVATDGPRAWFDEPLDGAYLDEGPVHIRVHAAHPEGVVDIVLSVDGDEVAVLDTGGGRLVTAASDWEPPDEGVYVLEVVGRDNDGDLTAPASVVVGIGVDPTSAKFAATSTTVAAGATSTTSTTAPGETTSSSGDGATTTSGSATSGTSATTATTKPTTTTAPPCPGTPTLVSPVGGAVVPSFTVTLDWGYTGCTPELFEWQVSFDPSFTRVVDSGTKDPPETEADVAFTCAADRGRDIYWRVRAHRGGPVTTSATGHFELPSPRLCGP